MLVTSLAIAEATPWTRKWADWALRLAERLPSSSLVFSSWQVLPLPTKERQERPRPLRPPRSSSCGCAKLTSSSASWAATRCRRRWATAEEVRARSVPEAVVSRVAVDEACDLASAVVVAAAAASAAAAGARVWGADRMHEVAVARSVSKLFVVLFIFCLRLCFSF